MTAAEYWLPKILFALTVSLTLLIGFCARPLGEALGVIDHPDSCRKLHAAPTPLVGGIAILLPLLVWVASAMIINPQIDNRLVLAVLLSGAGVGTVGFWDDQSDTKPLARTALLLVFLAVAFLVDPKLVAQVMRWGDFPPTEIDLLPYLLLMGLTCIGLVNAVNMADGQSGLVTGMFVIWSACLASIGGGAIVLVASAVCAAAVCVFAFNLTGKLFLGNCGSYGVTFVLGLLTAAAHVKGFVSLETVVVWFFLPVIDCLRLAISRPLSGRSPFAPDRNHLHHRLQAAFGAPKALAIYLGAVALTSLVATLLPHTALICVVALLVFYYGLIRVADPAPGPAQAASGAGASRG
ncbi:MAG TPA: MraY family glycosyltransferase [Rhizomicrobium sp.]|jgi:UDP-GlcNAc:undecaprenyl-phosphate GlcNAc-1-phosphate transferase|nr:MraY family glycosyltransferase [Rhizomicrobium sp.]